jgi:NTP pyrophosphatase (non-canonical NTP hydrolase)
MSDEKTTIQELRDAVHRFNDEREWQQFHTPKNLAASVLIEAAELLEHFQWIESSPSDQRPQLAEELADVVIYCLAMANALGIDLSHAIRDKLAQNDIKYPADECRGRF